MDLDALAQRLRDGQAVVYPTSTLPALGALPDASGLDAVFALKGRGETKPVSVGVRELADVAHLVDVPPLAHALLGGARRGHHRRGRPVGFATGSGAARTVPRWAGKHLSFA